MDLRAFPVIYANDVLGVAEFYERLGFGEHVRLPAADGSAGFVGLRRGGAEVLREPADMPWGERVACVRDPEGNMVSLANAPL